MEEASRIVVACSCEGTVALAPGEIARACGGRLELADQLCRRELDRYKALLGASSELTVSCTQEAPLFREIADEAGRDDGLSFVNIRETAGWSREGAQAGPKIAALLAAAREPVPPVAGVSMTSAGVALVYGRDEATLEVARRLSEHLDVTVLLTRPGEIAPPRTTDFPILQGAITGAKGHLGAFELRVDGHALPSPSSRDRLVFGAPRDGASLSCDIILDLSGGLPLFPADDLREGYLRADPRDPAAVERAAFRASHLVGEFEKPRFVDFSASLCAHSRSRITGCTRCLDVCPTGAITPAGQHVAIDPFVCAGCGSCASVCPTGAAAYDLPKADSLMRRLRTMLLAYREAGGSDAVILFHDGEHGLALIEALARFGTGLPASIIPVQVNEATQIGPEAFAAIFAYGVTGAAVLARGRPKHDLAPLRRGIELSNTVLAGLGYGADLVRIIETDDPDALRESLDGLPRGRPSPHPSSFLPTGEKRGVLEFAFRELHAAAPAPTDSVQLAAGAPFGGLRFEVESCTLCHACVGACPTSALSDNPDRPLLAFDESLCVQCGLCAATCPEDVIALLPQLDFAARSRPRRIVKEEEPFHCTACAKPFGTRAAIERVVAKLRGSHWMFSGEDGEARTRILTLCEDCRVEAAIAASFDPHAPERAAPRTSEDYIRSRALRDGPLSS